MLQITKFLRTLTNLLGTRTSKICKEINMNRIITSEKSQ